MALFVNGSRIRSAHGYVRPFSGLGGFGSLPALTDTAENRTFQAVLNRYAGKAKFTPITVDGKIGAKETAPAARKVGTWIAENIGGVSFENDYVQTLRSLDTTKIAAEAGTLAGLLDGIANSEGLPTTTGTSSQTLPVAVRFPEASAPSMPGGRVPGTVITEIPGLPAPAPATAGGSGIMWGAAAAAAVGLVLVLGGGKKRKRRR